MKPSLFDGRGEIDFDLAPNKERVKLCLKHGSPRFQPGDLIWLVGRKFNQFQIFQAEVMRIIWDTATYKYFCYSPTTNQGRGWYRESQLFMTEQQAIQSWK